MGLSYLRLSPPGNGRDKLRTDQEHVYGVTDLSPQVYHCSLQDSGLKESLHSVLMTTNEISVG